MKTSVYIATSLDGYIARDDGDIEWLHGSSDDTEDYGYEDFIATVDVLIMGRHSFEKVLSFGTWPYDNKTVVVLSSGSVSIPTQLPSTVESSSSSPASLLSSLELRGMKHAYIDGGKTIQGFLRAGLVNELIITRIPRLLGSGIPLFGSLAKEIILKHISTKSFSSGLTQSKYEIKGTA